MSGGGYTHTPIAYEYVPISNRDKVMAIATAQTNQDNRTLRWRAVRGREGEGESMHIVLVLYVNCKMKSNSDDN